MNSNYSAPTGGRRGWGHYFKMCALYVMLIVSAFLIYFVVGYLADLYEMQNDQPNPVNVLPPPSGQQINLQQEDYQRAMADTYGGTTPQETLQMYITAVEKGDYELASRYFIADKQAGELVKLKNASAKDNIGQYMSLLKQAKLWRATSSTNEEAVFQTQISNSPSLFIHFRKYPNGIWKIIEI